MVDESALRIGQGFDAGAVPLRHFVMMLSCEARLLLGVILGVRKATALVARPEAIVDGPGRPQPPSPADRVQRSERPHPFGGDRDVALPI